jgi:hypothetical protein
MPNITDSELILKLLEATTEGRLSWKKTDTVDRFASTYAGKWTLTIDKSRSPDSPYDSYWVALSNAEGEEILKIYSSDEPGLGELFEVSRRRALKVDEALTDLLKEIEPQKSDQKDEDIPF